MIIMQYYLMAIGSIILWYISIINLNEFKFKGKELILVIGLSSLIEVLLLNISEFAGLIPAMIIAVWFIYRSNKSLVKSISIPIISIIIFLIFDYINCSILIWGFGINPRIVRDTPKLYWLTYAIGSIVIFLTTKLLGKIINKKTKIIRLEYKGKFGVLIVITLLLTVAVSYANIIIQVNNNLGIEVIKLNSILFLAYFILLMIIMYILIKNIAKEMEYKNKQAQLQNLQDYVGKLESLYTDMRGFRHDYINILSSMIGYIENKDIDSLEKYFNEKIAPLGKGMESNNFKIGLLKNIKIPEIKGILSSKLIRAQELSIDVFIDVAEEIEKIDMDIIDLSRITGILLDNAIEAAEKSDKPSIKVAFINKKKSVFIIIINSIDEEVPIYKIYQKGFSTKGENRGLGLYNLKEITGKYKNVSIDTLIENGEFKQFIEITNR